MKTLAAGHDYELSDFEGSGSQRLVFIEKGPIGDGDDQGFQTIRNGTTNEEVLRMLIDRMQYLQAKAPCRENAIVITKLEESLMWLEKRTADRVARGVEGTQEK